MSERLKYQGRLAEKERRCRELKLRLEGLRDSIRDILDPFEKVEELKIEIAHSQMADMARTWTELKEMLAEIALIKKTLGR